VLITIAGTQLAVDPSAEAAFDAPKRALAVLGAAVAAAALVWRGRSPMSGRTPRAALAAWIESVGASAALVVALVVVALLGGMIAALAATHRAAAIDATRVALVLALLLPIGASRALAGRRGVFVLMTFLGAAAVNAVIAVLQALRLASPFEIESIAGRVDAGAMIGNEGLLAQVLVLATVAALAVAIGGGAARHGRFVALVLPVYLAGLAATANLTALVTLAIGAAAVLALVLRRRAALPVAALAVAVVTGVLAAPPLRARLVEAVTNARAGEWDAVVTYRLGPWAAAAEMMRERPLLGTGPGTFAAEFVPHRLAAEIRFGRRLTIPLLTSTFSEAHCDYLQLAAETGIPVAIAVVGAVVLVLRGLWRSSIADAQIEAIVVCAVLLTTAVAALTWFPLQRPVTAVPILLAAGRGWRVLREAR
jgi:O-antigen ligase